ncbi:hypothetical protein FACS1894109_19300 [Spirochaetia bacterium]|nr:hypothetical protein FACS1894109_19300 [Spirochaetia bacterium]GHV09230.1 hypothetical protein FACS189485_21570 [Spirochaetia bacterium]
MAEPITALSVDLDAIGHTLIAKLSNGKTMFYNMTELINNVPEFKILEDENIFASGIFDDQRVIWNNGKLAFGVDNIIYGGNEICID